jgi:hypothetical protein
MSFNIKIPYVIASHIKKYSAASSLVNKTKAGALGMVSGQLFVNNGTLAVPVLGNPTGMIVASGGTTRTLTAASSGSTNLFDSAAGITYTLPAPVVGLSYRFVWTVLQTSSAHVVVTNAGTVFLLGAVQAFSGEAVTPAVNLGPYQFAGNGSTHIKTTTNGTTTGGGIGSWLQFECLSATQWLVTGTIKSPSGTITTPFST